jgi:hypothetical protein
LVSHVKEKHRLKMLENRVLRKLFGTKRAEGNRRLETSAQ